MRRGPDFKYETYDRNFSVVFEGGQELVASAAPDYLGDASHANPEEMLAAAIASCHMLSFLAIVCKSGVTVDSYTDDAVAVLEKNVEGRMAVTEVKLNPKIVFSGENIPDPVRLKSFHEKAHRVCFIANSVKCRITVGE
jgi:organic hydroperoxide reductase OsmC/OhrA